MSRRAELDAGQGIKKAGRRRHLSGFRKEGATEKERKLRE